MLSRIWIHIAPIVMFIPSVLLALMIGFYPASLATSLPVKIFPFYQQNLIFAYNVAASSLELAIEVVNDSHLDPYTTESDTDTPPIDMDAANYVEMDGNIMKTSYFEFTIPESWVGMVEFVSSGTGRGYHLYYMTGHTPEGEEYGYYQEIFSISMYTETSDIASSSAHKDRFDILGEKDGILYVLTQRTDSALEFYLPSEWDQIKYMLSGYEFPEIISSFTFY